MRKNYLKLAVTLAFFGFASNSIAQVFTESMGTVAGTTAISAHEGANGFDNDNFTMSGTADIRVTSASSGYAGASGTGNVYMANNSSRTFQIAGISTVGLSNMAVNFGVSKNTTAANGTDLILEYSTDGVNYTAMSFPALPTGSGTAIWAYRSTTTTLPQAANLRLRWTNNSTSVQYRLDDISISEVVVCTPQL